MTPHAKSSLIKQHAGALGFVRVGVMRPSDLDAERHYRAWLEADYHGSMHYLAQTADIRANLAQLLPNVRSVIAVALSYHQPENEPRPQAPTPNRAPDAQPHSPRATGRVARYARGVDYHRVMREKLEQLVTQLRRDIPEPFEHRICVDTAPLLERAVAHAAGLGWIAKNTMLLHHKAGSYTYLAELLTTLELEPDVPQSDHCGTCTRCLDACPTDAFPAPRVLDARRCISYLTIEHRGKIDPQLQPLMQDWVFGCDICQEVCPFNRKARPAVDSQVTEARIPAELDLLDLIAMRSGAYRRLTRNAATERADRHMWRRNAAIAIGNTPASDRELDDALNAAASDDNAATAASARTAAEQRDRRATDRSRESGPNANSSSDT